MKKTDTKYQAYVAILEEELIPAMGCTEPIALAYAGAKAKEVLGSLPTEVEVYASGSIIKNVKGVIVPNTNHLKGIPTAVAAGIVGGDASKELEVLANIDPSKIEDIAKFLNEVPIEVKHLDQGIVFDIEVIVRNANDYVKVKISDYHTNIILIEKNGEVLFAKERVINPEVKRTDRSLLDCESIYDFVNTVDIKDIEKVLSRQIKYNLAIAKEGLENNYGTNIGKVLIKTYGNDVKTRAKAYAAAGSDARMNGCELPVVINSGSGNQGMTCSLPVIIYAEELKSGEDKLYRALALSNLMAIHIKDGIGTLSAYCGAVSAASGAGAAICYLMNGSYKQITDTVSNSLAIISGMVCDGAKASCAAKIASSIDSALLGLSMALNNQSFKSGDGIVNNSIESTIDNISKLGHDGMQETNREIIKMMVKC